MYQSGPGVLDRAADAAKVAGTIGGKVMQLISMLPANKQAEAAQYLTPQDIAYAEQYNALPPATQAYFDRLLEQSYNPPAPPGSSGSAELYNPFAYQDQPKKEAGLLGNMDPVTLGLLVGVPALFWLIGGNKR